MPPHHLPQNRWYFQPRDPQIITETVLWCLDREVNFRRYGLQIQVGEVNFYPTTGAIVLQGGGKLDVRGLDGFTRIIQRKIDGGAPGVLRHGKAAKPSSEPAPAKAPTRLFVPANSNEPAPRP